MDWQQVTALGIVALTAVWLAWARLRRRAPGRHGPGACPGCGGGGGASGPRETVVFHARKGERPEIRIRSRPMS